MKILVICTGNSCRSQMAHGFLNSFNNNLEVYSAGVSPSSRVMPEAVEVMKEKGIDISGHYPEHVDYYISDSFDYVITVCDYADEMCPVFRGVVRNRLHMPFRDPYMAHGSAEVMRVYREVRDEIEAQFKALYKKEIEAQL